MPNQIMTEQFEQALERSLGAKKWNKVTPLQRVGTTAIGLGVGAGIPIALGRLLKKQPAMRKFLIPSTLLMGALGYTAPDFANKLIDTYPEDEELAKKYIKQIPGQTEKMIKSVLPLQKTSSWKLIKSIGKGVGKTLKYGAKGVKEVARGVNLPLKMPKGTPLSERALSIASKGAVGVGAYAAGSKLLAPPPPADYVTFLRNQVLAGNIQAGQLTQSELDRVMKRGV